MRATAGKVFDDERAKMVTTMTIAVVVSLSLLCNLSLVHGWLAVVCVCVRVRVLHFWHGTAPSAGVAVPAGDLGSVGQRAHRNGAGGRALTVRQPALPQPLVEQADGPRAAVRQPRRHGARGVCCARAAQ